MSEAGGGGGGEQVPVHSSGAATVSARPGRSRETGLSHPCQEPEFLRFIPPSRNKRRQLDQKW